MIQTLGFPSQKRAIEALLADGGGVTDIAARIGVPPARVAVYRSFLRFEDRHGRTYHAARRRSFMVTPSLYDALKGAALERGMGVSRLAGRLIETLTDEGLLAAVLDDDGKGDMAMVQTAATRCRNLDVSRAAFERLRPAAKRYRVPLGRFAHHVLWRIADADLVGAVLGEGASR